MSDLYVAYFVSFRKLTGKKEKKIFLIYKESHI
jgi:hypothetical protein